MLRDFLDQMSRPLAIEAAWNAMRILRYRKYSKFSSLDELAERWKQDPAMMASIELVRYLEKIESTGFRQFTEEQVDSYVEALEAIVRERSILELDAPEGLGEHILKGLRGKY